MRRIRGVVSLKYDREKQTMAEAVERYVLAALEGKQDKVVNLRR